MAYVFLITSETTEEKKYYQNIAVSQTADELGRARQKSDTSLSGCGNRNQDEASFITRVQGSGKQWLIEQFPTGTSSWTAQKKYFLQYKDHCLFSWFSFFYLLFLPLMLCSCANHLDSLRRNFNSLNTYNFFQSSLVAPQFLT